MQRLLNLIICGTLDLVGLKCGEIDGIAMKHTTSKNIRKSLVHDVR